MNYNTLAIVVLVCQVPAGSAFSQNWTSFQNGGRPHTESTAAVPAEWDADQFAWEIDLPGFGQSSPVSHDGIVYLTSVIGDQKETLLVQAINLTGGAELWRHEAVNSTPEKNNNYVSRAAPTPVCDDKGVVAFFEGGNVVALTPAGDLRWQRDLVADYGPIKARHGLASSLEQDERSVFVWVERQDEPYVLALDKATGETLWKSPGIGATSWSSPRLVPVGDAHHLVLSAVGTLAGYDTGSGERLWTLEGIVGNSTPTPVPLGEGRLLLPPAGTKRPKRVGSTGELARPAAFETVAVGSQSMRSATASHPFEGTTCCHGIKKTPTVRQSATYGIVFVCRSRGRRWYAYETTS